MLIPGRSATILTKKSSNSSILESFTFLRSSNFNPLKNLKFENIVSSTLVQSGVLQATQTNPPILWEKSFLPEKKLLQSAHFLKFRLWPEISRMLKRNLHKTSFSWTSSKARAWNALIRERKSWMSWLANLPKSFTAAMIDKASKYFWGFKGMGLKVSMTSQDVTILTTLHFSARFQILQK